MAGPAPRRYDPDEQYFECANCSAKVTRNESYPCSGSDTCLDRLCEGCKQDCRGGCGLPACADHMLDYGGELTCSLCVALILEEAEMELEEAK